MGALSGVALDVLTDCLHLHPVLFQVLNPFVEVFSSPRQFQDHDPFLAGQYGRLEDIESEVEVTGKETDDRFFYFCLWESKHEHSRIHIHTSIKLLRDFMPRSADFAIVALATTAEYAAQKRFSSNPKCEIL